MPKGYGDFGAAISFTFESTLRMIVATIDDVSGMVCIVGVSRIYTEEC